MTSVVRQPSIWESNPDRGQLRPFIEAQDAAFVAAVRKAHPELCRDIRTEEQHQAITQVWPEAGVEEDPPVDEEPLVHLPFWKTVVHEVCEKHGISLQEIISRRRAKDIVAARQEAFFRLYKETAMSLPKIGYRMGGRHHATVLHGVRAHKKRMAAAETLAREAA